MKKKIVTITFITLFSIGLWASVSLSGEYFTTITVPVKIVDIPPNYTVGNISEKEISLSIKAVGWEISKLTLGRLVEFNISAELKHGQQKVLVKNFVNNNSWLTSTVQLGEIVPSEITFSIEKLASKKVKVVPDLDLKYKEGYGLTSDITLNPDSVIIYGAESIISKIKSVKTESHVINNAEGTVNQQIPLEKLDGISYNVNNCSIKFDVQKIVDKTFENLPVIVRNVPKGRQLILFPEHINIVLRGGINLLGKMTNNDLKPYVDFWTAYRDESGAVEVKIEPPKYTVVIDKSPDKLQYIIKQL